MFGWGKKKGRVSLAYALSQNRVGLGRQRREPETQGAWLEGRGQVEPPLYFVAASSHSPGRGFLFA